MPLLEQLKHLSEPGNPGGVCAVSSAVTAHALMNGPESLTGVTALALPLTDSGKTVINPQTVKTGGAPSEGLDVSKISGGVAGVWKWDKGKGSELDGGRDMLGWLTKEAPAGVYVGRVDDLDDSDPHYFNIAKTNDGKVYLVDSSMQNFVKLKGPDDVGLLVTGQSAKEGEDGQRQDLGSDEEFNFDDFDTPVEEVTNENKVGKEIQNDSEEDKKQSQKEELGVAPFAKVYCSSNMKLDYCGKLHPDCALELQQSLKRSVREDYNPGVKPTTGQKIQIT